MVRWKYDKMISWEHDKMGMWYIFIQTPFTYWDIIRYDPLKLSRYIDGVCHGPAVLHTPQVPIIIIIMIIIILTMMIFRWQWCPGRHWGASIRGRETPWHGNIYITYWGSGRKVCPNHDHDYQPRGWKGLSTKLWSWWRKDIHNGFIQQFRVDQLNVMFI